MNGNFVTNGFVLHVHFPSVPRFRYTIACFSISSASANPLDAFITSLPIMVFAVSHVKYVVAVGMALAGMAPGSGFFWCSLGACSGTLLWVFAGQKVARMWNTRFPNPSKRFGKRTRFLVRLRRSGGIWGVAFLSPVLLSLPVGCLLALTFVKSRWEIVFAHVISILFWGGIFFGGLQRVIFG